MNLRLVPLSLILLAATGCGDGRDMAKVYAELEAITVRTCACKDQGCVSAADGDYGRALKPALGRNKDKEAVGKLAALQTKQNDCVSKAMAAMGAN